MERNCVVLCCVFVPVRLKGHMQSTGEKARGRDVEISKSKEVQG